MGFLLTKTRVFPSGDVPESLIPFLIGFALLVLLAILLQWGLPSTAKSRGHGQSIGDGELQRTYRVRGVSCRFALRILDVIGTGSLVLAALGMIALLIQFSARSYPFLLSSIVALVAFGLLGAVAKASIQEIKKRTEKPPGSGE